MTAYDLDFDVDHCAGCGTLTGSACGLCSRCLAETDDDRDYWRGSSNIDGGPHG